MKEAPSLWQLILDIFFDALDYITIMSRNNMLVGLLLMITSLISR